MDRAIAATLLALVLFGFLRARTVVGETWGVRPSRSAFGIVATVVAAVVLAVVWRSALGVLVAAAVAGVGAYAAWRLRRA
jgi:hypothetical protein